MAGRWCWAEVNEFYVHTRNRGVRAFDLVSGDKTAFMTNEPVLDEQLVFAAETKVLKARRVAARYRFVRAYRADNKELVWEVENVDGSGDIIKAGNRIYAAGRDQLTALQLNG